jgi:Uncharacterised nucleotidyltransferase
MAESGPIGGGRSRGSGRAGPKPDALASGAIRVTARIARRAEGSSEQAGRSLALVLRGAWRRLPPRTEVLPDALAQAVPGLVKTGAAGLGWWKIRTTDARLYPAARPLQEAYRLQALQRALAIRHFEQVVQALQAAGVEPFLAKGWVSASHYPESGLRPPGDIDLYIRPEQFRAGQIALRSSDGLAWAVDLHAGCPDLGDRAFHELYRRSRILGIGNANVRVLGPEDHLRLLCLHFLRHGAWRPLWLCDIAAALETRPPDFEWDYFLGGSRKHAAWAACAIGLAQQLLDARMAEAPGSVRAQRLPRWLVPAVLRQWGSAYSRFTDSPRFLTYLRRPRGLWQALRQRWPNPIEATISVGGRFNAWPRFPFQIGDCLFRAARLFAPGKSKRGFKALSPTCRA